MKLRPFSFESPSGFLLCLAVALAAFWRVLFLPFVQDDWLWLGLFQERDTASMLADILEVQGAFFYRPAAEVYLFLMYKVVGIHAWPFHVVALLVHSCNAWIAGRIIARVVADERLGLAAGLVYAAAVSIHLDPLVWAVGAYDLGGAFFFLLSIRFFLAGRAARSALCYLAGCLFKESVVTLPFILVILDWAARPGFSRGDGMSLLRRLRPHVAILLVVIGLKVIGGRLDDGLSPTHPYALAIAGSHVLENAFHLSAWMLQAFVPVGVAPSPAFRWILAVLAVLAVALTVFAPAPRRRLILASGLWVVAALLPVLFLSNHCYRYYATYALPGFVAAVLLLAGEVERRLAWTGRPNGFANGLVVVALLLSVVQANRMLGEGLGQRTLADGTNGLIRRAAIVERVEPELRAMRPRPPADAVLLLDGVDLWAFNKDSGPRIWCGQPTLRVADLADLRQDGGRWWLEGGAASQIDAFTGARTSRVELDPALILAFRLDGDVLLRLSPTELRH